MPHARCQECGDVFHVSAKRVEEWASVEKDDEGFARGICERCAREQDRKDRTKRRGARKPAPERSD